MSADNGVYVLKTKDRQCRAVEAQAIENLWYDTKAHCESNLMVSEALVDYFGDCKYTYDFDKAMRIAYNIYRKLPVCEYGIKVFESDKTWKQIKIET